MKPWTWKQLARESFLGEDTNDFVKQYGALGAVALEIANRMEYWKYGTTREHRKAWKAFTRDCGCAMCRQWHHNLSYAQLVDLYRRRYPKCWK